MKTDPTNPLIGRRILIAVSGSIAAIKTPILVSALIKKGAQVRCVVTPSASKLISPVALASISRNRCYQDKDLWDSSEPRPLHIALAEWAEIIVVAPLSASSLARWTNGLADGLLASLLLASECPILAAGAMNTAMWRNNFVQKNLNLLKTNPSVLLLEPSSGLLACDRIGEGRMADPELIELAIESTFIQRNDHGEIKRDWSGRKLLVTAGPTVEAIDQARLITNRSSGMMGVLLAQAARLRGAKVNLVHGPLKVPNGWLEGINTLKVSTGEEMRLKLQEIKSKADAIAMAAAICDIRFDKKDPIKKFKKESLISNLTNSLEPVPDLLNELVATRTKTQVILGFSALTGSDSEIQKHGRKKMEKKGCDLLMANPIDREGQGFDKTSNGGWLIGKEGFIQEIQVTSKLVLAHKLLDALLELQIQATATSELSKIKT